MTNVPVMIYRIEKNRIIKNVIKKNNNNNNYTYTYIYIYFFLYKSLDNVTKTLAFCHNIKKKKINQGSQRLKVKDI